MMFSIWLISLAVMVIFFLLLVFFFVLMERKMLGLSQSRLGPKKVSLMGILQSLADFLKLAGKMGIFNKFCSLKNYRGLVYSISLVFFIISCGLFMSFFSCYVYVWNLDYSGLAWVMVLSSVGGYGFLMCGWGGNSKYSLYGGIRAAFSSMTFEGCLMCMMVFCGYMSYGYNLYLTSFYGLGYFFCGIVMYVLSLVAILAECQRSPFDFSESESDLVSGFKTDYYGFSFAVMFACEYAAMVFFGWFFGVLFFGSGFEVLFMFMNTFFLIFVRACFPRIRYDYYMTLMWKKILVLMLLVLFSCFVMFV